MVFTATLNNISVISWQSVLLLEETTNKTEKTTDLSKVTESHNVVWSILRLSGIRTHNVSGDRY
jgi:hypothetical protein